MQQPSAPDLEKYVVGNLTMKEIKLEDGSRKVATQEGYTLWANVVGGHALCWSVTDRDNYLLDTLVFTTFTTGESGPDDSPRPKPKFDGTGNLPSCPSGPIAGDGGAMEGRPRFVLMYVLPKVMGVRFCWKECF